MEEKQITIKLSDLMERFKETTSNPLSMLMAKIDPLLYGVMLLRDLFPEYKNEIAEYARIKASEEDAQNRAN